MGVHLASMLVTLLTGCWPFRGILQRLFAVAFEYENKSRLDGGKRAL